MFTYTRSERKWVRETTLYPLSFPLALLKQKRVPNFFGTLLRCVRDSNPWPHAWQACILTNWTNAPFSVCFNSLLNSSANLRLYFKLPKFSDIFFKMNVKEKCEIGKIRKMSLCFERLWISSFFSLWNKLFAVLKADCVEYRGAAIHCLIFYSTYSPPFLSSFSLFFIPKTFAPVMITWLWGW